MEPPAPGAARRAIASSASSLWPAAGWDGGPIDTVRASLLLQGVWWVGVGRLEEGRWVGAPLRFGWFLRRTEEGKGELSQARPLLALRRTRGVCIRETTHSVRGRRTRTSCPRRWSPGPPLSCWGCRRGPQTENRRRNRGEFDSFHGHMRGNPRPEPSCLRGRNRVERRRPAKDGGATRLQGVSDAEVGHIIVLREAKEPLLGAAWVDRVGRCG